MDHLQYVNIRQGTRSVKRFSNGNTLPLVQRPFGFAAFAPQTDSTGDKGWFYHPDHRSFEGIRLTNQPSPWIGDKASVVFTAQRGTVETEPDRRWSGFRPDTTVLMPHYMRYVLTGARAEVELTPTLSGACMRVKFACEDKKFFSVLTTGEKCCFEWKDNCIAGCTHSHTDRGHFKLYIVVKFPEGAVESCRVDEGKGAHVQLAVSQVEARISASFISVEQAMVNLEREHTYKDFDALLAENEAIWEERLSRIEVRTQDEDLLRTFYSCLYRAQLFPRQAHETAQDGTLIHFQPETGTVEHGPRYTATGFWDTYRTVFSLLPLICKDDYVQMLRSFLLEYSECGWLPRWSAMEAVNCMPSTAIDMVLADAVMRGALSDEEAELALEAMLKHANHDSPVPVYGREGCGDYVAYGYVPSDRCKESVNLTLDAAYGDHCIALIAQKLGKAELAKEYFVRAKRYQNVYDPTVGFMRGKGSDGKFDAGFCAETWSSSYTEAGPWQTTFAVQHDLDGLAELMGGKEALLGKLDALFAAEPIYNVGGYSFEIHEMTEMANADWGQCALSNQPSFHIPFIYAHFGQKEKSRMWVERICREGFSWRDDGFPGDEDNGSMACWYLFAVMGFYPLHVGCGKYVSTGMLADDVRILGRTVEETVEFA